LPFFFLGLGGFIAGEHTLSFICFAFAGALFGFLFIAYLGQKHSWTLGEYVTRLFSCHGTTFNKDNLLLRLANLTILSVRVFFRLF